MHLLSAREASVVSDNLQRCYPAMPVAERRQLRRRIMCHTGMYIVENCWVWAQSPQRLKRIVQVQGGEHLERAQKKGGGVVLLSTHGANPDLVSRWLSGHTTNPWTVYTPPRTSRRSVKLLPQLRQRNSSLQALPTDQGAGVLRRLYRGLKEGGTALLWPDLEPVRGAGAMALLFGQQVRVPLLPWRLATRLNLPLLWCWCTRTKGGFQVHFRTPDSGVYDPQPERALAAINRQLEEVIKEMDAQYFYWTYKRFRHSPAASGSVPPEDRAEEHQ